MFFSTKSNAMQPNPMKQIQWNQIQGTKSKCNPIQWTKSNSTKSSATKSSATKSNGPNPMPTTTTRRTRRERNRTRIYDLKVGHNCLLVAGWPHIPQVAKISRGLFFFCRSPGIGCLATYLIISPVVCTGWPQKFARLWWYIWWGYYTTLYRFLWTWERVWKFSAIRNAHIVANPGGNFIVNLIFFVSETL